MKLALLAGVPVSVIVVGAIILNQQLAIEQPDERYCYARDDQHHAAIVIDNSFTAESSTAQFRSYRTGMMAAYDDAPPNAQISIFTSAKDVNAALIDPVFTICKPAASAAEQKAMGTPSKPSPYLKRTAEDAKQQYLEAVESVLSDASNSAKQSGNSPILERMQAISRHKLFSGEDRSLTVITDGIQNSEIARFCVVKGDMPAYAEFQNRMAFDHVRPNSFKGTEVKLLLVEFGELPSAGAPYCSNNELRTWWPDYYTGNGAENVETTRLPFGADG
ncbi:MAG: hypothetical protein DHS20C05_06690 [Hyphococcus sp.]|nr:MAG: hypothetical protein DHS20C05_06690 [Marinicaulis sp.]